MLVLSVTIQSCKMLKDVLQIIQQKLTDYELGMIAEDEYIKYRMLYILWFLTCLSFQECLMVPERLIMPDVKHYLYQGTAVAICICWNIETFTTSPEVYMQTDK